jgi:hypothetical protein
MMKYAKKQTGVNRSDNSFTRSIAYCFLPITHSQSRMPSLQNSSSGSGNNYLTDKPFYIPGCGPNGCSFCTVLSFFGVFFLFSIGSLIEQGSIVLVGGKEVKNFLKELTLIFSLFMI